MSDSPQAGHALARTLRLKDLVLIVVGTVIGSGIFIVPATVLSQTDGRLGLALWVWFLAGVLSLLGALTYGELGAADPEAGGLYVYVRDAFGPLPAFLYGWTLFFVISSGSVATLAVAFTSYLEALVPLGPVGLKAVPVLMIATVAAVNVLGTRKGASLQNWTTLLKVAAILIMSVLLIVLGAGNGAGSLGTGVQGGAPGGTEGPLAGLFTLPVLSSVGVAMIGVLWAYEGWQYVTFSAGETIDPQRTFPRGIVLGTLALIAIYMLANVGYVSALDIETAQRSGSIASEAVTALMGPTAGVLITLAILLSMFSAANGLTLTAPRVYYAMSRDRVFFWRLARVHPTFGTPAFAILASSAWAMVLAVSGTFEQLLTYVVFVGWIFYALGAASIFVYRRRQPDRPRPFQVPGYPWTPILFVLAAAAIVLNTLFAQPGRAFLGLGVVALGTPAYYFWRSRVWPE